MALRASVADSRRIASPALRNLMGRRSAELGGLLLGLLGLAFLLALISYDPRDPSLNTATTRHVSNIAGAGGAVGVLGASTMASSVQAAGLTTKLAP